MLPKTDDKLTNGFICSKTIAVNIPSLHSRMGQSDIINTTSQSVFRGQLKLLQCFADLLHNISPKSI